MLGLLIARNICTVGFSIACASGEFRWGRVLAESVGQGGCFGRSDSSQSSSIRRQQTPCLDVPEHVLPSQQPRDTLQRRRGSQIYVAGRCWRARRRIYGKTVLFHGLCGFLFVGSINVGSTGAVDRRLGTDGVKTLLKNSRKRP